MKTNQRLLSALLALVMIITMIPFGLVAYAADEDTISISNAAELVAFATDFNDKKVAKEITTVKLTADIDMSGITDWTPIGSQDNKFGLVFDGQNHVIKNLTAKGTKDEDLGGIFGYVSGTVQNLAVADSSFSFTARVGGIAANASGTISNCAVYRTDIIIDVDYDELHIGRAGGIVGVLTGGTVSESYSRANIYISDDYGMNYAGGIVAYAQSDAKVSNCYYAGNMASINGVYNVAGGIIGRSYASTIENCYVAGLVSGEISGAIVGWTNSNITLTNNYYYKDSNICESQKSDGDGFVTTAGNQVASAAALTPDSLNADAFEAQTERTDGYAFPILKNNAFDNTDADAPDEDKTNFAGGRGTLYAPYIIETKAQLAKVRNYFNAAFLLDADITFDKGEKFSPIGTKEPRPFCGMFDGGNHTIRGLVIESTADDAAMFIYNFGVIKNFTLTEIEAVEAQEEVLDEITGDVITPAVAAEDAIPSSVTLNTKTNIANAAAIAAFNYGRVENITSDANVTLTSNQLSANAAGIVANNYGVVDSCKNAGNIFVDNTAVINDTTPNYKNVFENVSVNVGGLVAINNATGSVSGSSSNTARSLLISAPNTNGIAQSQFVALNYAGTIGTTSDCSFKYGTFMFTMTAETAHRSGKVFSTEDPIDLTGCTATLNGTAIGVDPTVEYSKLVENYQKITVTYTKDTVDYKAIFLAWLDYTNITVNSDNVKKSFLLGEKLSTGGLVVSGQTSEGNTVNLKEVENDNDNGYRVTVYDEYKDADNRGTVVTDLTTVSFTGSKHTYTVAISYYGKIYGTYEITVYGIEKIAVVPTATTALEGTTPTFKVTAYYGDPSNTTKKITKKNYTYAIDTDKEPSAVTGYVSPVDIEAETATAPTFPDAGTYYIYVNAGGAYGKSDPITVIGSDAKVSNLKATVGTKDNKVECDNVQLDWTYENAGKDGVTFKVQRIENINLQKLLDAGLTMAAAQELIGSLVWKTLKSGITETTYTDTKSESGTEYKYRVVVVVSGESCADDDATTIEGVEPATPSSFAVTAVPTGNDIYYSLGDNIKHKGIEVKATYANGTSEAISYSSEQTKDTLKYYLDTSAFDSSKAGKYTIKIMHCSKASILDILTKYETVASYTVEVLNPTYVSKVSADYEVYPEGYSQADFKATLSVQLAYVSPLDGTVIDLQKVEDTSVVNLTNYDASIPTTGDNTDYATRTITVKHPKCTNDADGKSVTVTFVKSIAPTNVVGEANTDGTVKLTWDEVPGAKSYNIYRSTSAGGSYELVASRNYKASVTVEAGSRVQGKDDSETLESGRTYYYKVCGVIAGKETAKSAASDAVTTAKPISYLVDIEDAKVAFALGDKFRAKGIDVYAIYDVGTVEEPQTKSVKLTSRKYTATCSGGLDADGYFETVGTYNVTIKVNDMDTQPIKYAVGDTDTGKDYYEIKVYDIAALEAKVKKDAYPVGYEFSKEDIKLKAIYGENIGEENEVIAKKKTIKASNEEYVMTGTPDMGTVGTKNAIVTYAGKTATVAVNVYDPDATVSVKGNANDDYTASLVIDASIVPFVEAYTIVRSTSPDMDENLVTKEITEKSKTVTVKHDESDYLITYTDSAVSADTNYYYTVTPVFLDGTDGNSSAFVQIKTNAIPPKSEIEPVAAKGVTRSDNNLSVSQVPDAGVDASSFVKDYIVTEDRDETCIKVYDGSGNQVTDLTKPIGTGYVIELYTNSSYTRLEDKVTVVVLGDTNGDGKITSGDYVKIMKEIMDDPIKGAAYRKAADINADGKISSADYVKVMKIIMAR